MVLTPQGTARTKDDVGPIPVDPIPVKIVAPVQRRIGPGNTGTSGAYEFVSPASGIVRLQCLGAGSIANLAWAEGGNTWALNNGVALTAGSFFEFEFATDGQDQIFLTGVTLARAFWRP